MPYQQRRRRRYVVWEKLRPVILVLFGLASLAGLWWWLIQLGPNPVAAKGDVVSNHAEDVEVASIRREVAALRGAFEAEGSSADVKLLEEAITKQRELVNKLEGNAGQAELRRLNELEEELASALAKELNLRIGKLDAQATTSHEAGNLGAAEAAWTEALRLQTKVNRSGATSAMKNFMREGRLARQLQELVAEPLAHEVREALGAARSAAAAEEWSHALAALTTAQEVQLRINSDFPRSRHAGVAALDLDPDAERTKSDEMATFAPNAAGFFDLLGNVAEWLLPRPNQTGGWALVSGGSFLDQPEVLRKVPSIVTQRSERARHIGFRVLVEMATE
ncbi:MAG: SUMF1/EgtB/PvdO family nonheme iron enzyme [Opitutaceae bacterium]